MRFHYRGEYSGDPETLPAQRMEPNAVKFKEPEPEKLGLILNAVSIVILSATVAGAIIRFGGFGFFSVFGALLSLLVTFPHELIHACFFRGDVCMYTYLKIGAAFVIGEEDFSKARFVWMSIMPSVVFGFIPYIAFMICPELRILGTMGAFCIAAGAGDYMNIVNALVQVPKGGKIFMHQMNSYWYLPVSDI